MINLRAAVLCVMWELWMEDSFLVTGRYMYLNRQTRNLQIFKLTWPGQKMSLLALAQTTESTFN